MSERPETLSPIYHLADVILEGRFAGWVTEQRAAGRSWRRIALDLRDLTDRRVDVTHETLRSWFPHDRNGGEGAAA